MKGILLTLFLIIGTLSFSNAWSAIALNKETGGTGYSYNHAAESNAVGAALRACGKDCVLVTSFYNSCGAVAWASKTDSRLKAGYATGNGYEYYALEECKKIPGAKDCKIVLSFCSTY